MQAETASVVLAAARVFGCLLPLPGGDVFGTLSRVVSALVIGWYVAPHVQDGVPLTVASLFLEVITGLLISIPVALAVEGIANAGEFFDSSRGQSIGFQQDPLTVSTTSTGAIAARQGFMTIGIAGGALEGMIGLLVKSYGVLPAGNAGPLGIFSGEVVRAAVYAYGWALAPFALAAILCVLVECCTAFIGRMAHGVGTFECAFIIKFATCLLLIVIVLRHQSQADLCERLLRLVPVFAS